MRAFFDAMRLETLEAVRAWPVGTPFPTLPTMRRVTLRVILRTGLGLAPGPEMDRFEQQDGDGSCPTAGSGTPWCS